MKTKHSVVTLMTIISFVIISLFTLPGQVQAAETVNGQITDAVTQANVKVLGDSPAQSLSNLYQTVSQSLSLSAQNAVTAQQQSNIIHQTTTTQGVSALYSINNATLGGTTNDIIQPGDAESISNMLDTIKALKGVQ